MEKVGNPVVEKSIRFAVMIIDFCEKLQDEKKICCCQSVIKSRNKYWSKRS